MDLDLFTYFVSVANTLNFSEAARRNHTSQSTVSRAIRDLEEHFGVRLFRRTNRDVALTGEGSALLHYANAMLDSYHAAQLAMRQLSEGLVGRISIAGDSCCTAFLPEFLRAFHAQYPEIALDLNTLNPTDQLTALREQRYDFFFLPADLVANEAGVSYEIVCEDTLCFLLPAGMALDAHPFQSLRETPFCLLSESCNPILFMEIIDLCQTYHLTPRLAGQFESPQDVFTAVAAGLGVSILPRSLARQADPATTQCQEITVVESSIASALAWHAPLLSTPASLFVQALHTYLHA